MTPSPSILGGTSAIPASPTVVGPSQAKTDDSRLQQVLGELVRAAESALGDDLVSVVLFGSGAEGHLRATSDVNLVVVLKAFTPARLDAARDAFRAAHAAIRVAPMFLLQEEIDLAAQSFPVKLADIARRRRVLHGPDVFAHLTIPRSALLAHLRQGLFNVLLRLRAAYVERSSRQEQLALAVADAAGPLRAFAAALLELEGARVETPKAALERVAGELKLPGSGDLLHHVSDARETRMLPPGVASATMTGLLSLTSALLERARRLPENA